MEPSPIRASVIITTYNRCGALQATLVSLAHQTLASERYEVLVVDNGSADGTTALLESDPFPFRLRWFRFSENQGIAAARNRGIREAVGECLILLSDDVLTPPDFLERHLEALALFPNCWIGGRCEQLPSLNDTSFGRFLTAKEAEFGSAYRGAEAAPGVWETEWPTARCLSLPRKHLDRIGLFDEQFRDACEDQDLAYRARLQLHTRFLVHSGIVCVHNDQAADLSRYCRAQARGARDTVKFYRKYRDWYASHGLPPIMRLNGPITREDNWRVLLVKTAKFVVSGRGALAMLETIIGACGRAPLPERVRWRLFRLLIGLHIRRGWREGLRTAPTAAEH